MAENVGPPTSGTAATDAMLLPDAVTPAFVHEYARLSPFARNGMVVPQVVPLSVTTTDVSPVSPVLVTTMTKMAVPPDGTIWPGLVLVPAGDLFIEIDGDTTGTVT